VEPDPVEWLGSSRGDIRELRASTQQDLGYELFRVQVGLMPTNFRPMPSVGAGTYEIRVSDAEGIARLM
jgi:phage-related protein